MGGVQKRPFSEHLAEHQPLTSTTSETSMTTLSVTYGYARVSKSDDDSKNLGTQLRILAEHGIRDQLVYTDVASGRSLQRLGWQALMEVVQPGDTVVVAFLDRFSRNFEEGVRSQAELTRRDIGIVAIRENIDSREGSAAAKFFRRSMLAQGPTRWTRPVSGSSWGWHGPERRESG